MPTFPDGRLAFISQSGAILTSVLDWATARDIGFSAMVSLGNTLDIDLAALLDHFATDQRTSAILVYMESIRDAAAFMSAARHAARIKPVIVIKVGRHPEGARAGLSHTGALAGSDAVYEAAYARSRGLARLQGRVLTENACMRAFCRALGFSERRLAEEGYAIVAELDLHEPANPGIEEGNGAGRTIPAAFPSRHPPDLA